MSQFFYNFNNWENRDFFDKLQLRQTAFSGIMGQNRDQEDIP